MIIGILKKELDGTKPCTLLVNRISHRLIGANTGLTLWLESDVLHNVLSGIAGEECFGYCADAGSWESSR